MAYCQYCGSQIDGTVKFCPNCGGAQDRSAARNGGQSTASTANTSDPQWSKTAKTIGAVAGTALGLSVLGSMFHRRRHRPMGPPPGRHHGPGGPGPMGGPGGRW